MTFGVAAVAAMLVTAAAYDLPSMVVGRFLQGVGGGGLVPATLALVADLYPVERRGVPLGIVSAVQEVGSVVGPLYGALILAVSDWRVIFAVNLVVGLVPGYAKVDGCSGSHRFLDMRRIFEVGWTFDGGDEIIQQLDVESPTMQTIELPKLVAVSKVRMTIRVTTPPGTTGFDYAPVSEVTVA
jgi:MFS family permease